MLVLNRRREESIIIGGNIEIRILRLQGDRVRVGVDAPREVSVMRKELLDAEPPRDRDNAA
jgi:carbon storage regulator